MDILKTFKKAKNEEKAKIVESFYGFNSFENAARTVMLLEKAEEGEMTLNDFKSVIAAFEDAGIELELAENDKGFDKKR